MLVNEGHLFEDSLPVYDSYGVLTAHPNSDWTTWIVGYSGTPSGNCTLTWKGGAATGNFAYDADNAQMALDAQAAWDAAYGANTAVITAQALTNGKSGLKIVVEGAGLPGGILAASNPSGGGTAVCGALIEDAPAVLGFYHTNTVVNAKVDIYDDVQVPSNYLLWTIPANDPVAKVNVGLKTVRGLVIVPAGANVLVVGSDPI